MKRILITVASLWFVLGLNTYAKEPVPEYQDYIASVCETFSTEENEIPPEVIEAMVFCESSWCTGAANGPYCGLMQVSIGHKTKMKELGVTDLFNGYQNLLIGISLLADYIEQEGNLERGIDAYAGYQLDESFYESGKHTKYYQKVMRIAENIANEKSLP